MRTPIALSVLAIATTASAQPLKPIPKPTNIMEVAAPKTVGFVHSVAKSWHREAQHRITCLDNPDINNRKDAVVVVTLNAAPANQPVGLGYHFQQVATVLYSDSWNADPTAKQNNSVGLPAGRWCILSSIPNEFSRGSAVSWVVADQFKKQVEEYVAGNDKTFVGLSFNVIAFVPPK